nr:2-phospho-L-lactate guanylyltransferase [uncultured Cohaesibacter sp.]
MSTRMLVLIPMKDPAAAKSRLAPALSEAERSQLALLLFKTVVRRIQQAVMGLKQSGSGQGRIDVAVVSNSAEIVALAAELQIGHINEQDNAGLNSAVSEAAKTACDLGYDRLCILPGDLADPSREDIARLLSYPVDGQTVALCPSQDLGTNALVVPLPCPVAFSFGPDSFTRHFSRAADAGMMPVILPLKSLRRDVDTLADLDYLDDGWKMAIGNGERA